MFHTDTVRKKTQIGKMSSSSSAALGDLPPEIWVKILGFVRDPRDLARCARVDRIWRAFFEDAQHRAEKELWWGPVVDRGIDQHQFVILKDFPFPWNQPRSLAAFLRACSTMVPPARGLSLRNNRLTGIPEEPLSKLTHLMDLILIRNRLTTVPTELGNLDRLKNLFFSHNRLTYVPRELGKLKYLHRLDLSHNRLSTLPLEFVHLRHDTVTVKPGNPHLYVPDILNPQVKSIDPWKGRNKRGRRSRQV